MSDYGFNFNASAVIDEKGKASVGINFKDSDGFKFDAEESGSVQEVLENLSKRFMDEFNAEVARIKSAEKEKAVKEPEKASATPDMVKRLRHLEQENAKLRVQVEANSKKILDENDKIVQKRAAEASAKYKDPNYNKPGDDKAKTAQAGVSAKSKKTPDKDSFGAQVEATRKALQSARNRRAFFKELLSDTYDDFEFAEKFLDTSFLNPRDYDYWRW